MLDLWDASHPIHIIGHSFGGNTALILLTLLAQDYWGYGTSAAWVSSITAICSPLRGCTLPFAWGLDTERPLRIGGKRRAANKSAQCVQCPPDGERALLPECLPINLEPYRPDTSVWLCCSRYRHRVHRRTKAQQQWPWLKGLYDFQAGHWVEDTNWKTGITMRHPFWINGDNTLHDATPAASAACLRAARPHLGNLHLISVTADTNVKPILSEAQLSRAKIITAASTITIALIAVRFRTQLRSLLPHTVGQSGMIPRSCRPCRLVLRHRTVNQLRSPKLAAIVALASASTIAAAAGAAAAAATLLGIPLRLPRGQELAPLRPFLERIRPILHAYLLPWLVKPVFRLNAAAIHRTAALLQGDLNVTFALHRTDTNDGIVDLPSQRGIDASDTGGVGGGGTKVSSPRVRRRRASMTDVQNGEGSSGSATTANNSSPLKERRVMSMGDLLREPTQNESGSPLPERHFSNDRQMCELGVARMEIRRPLSRLLLGATIHRRGLRRVDGILCVCRVRIIR